MRPLTEIHAEIDRASDARAGLRRTLGEGHDPAVVAELKQMDELLAALWQEHRAVKAALRFGERERIVQRARAEERLERAA